MDRRTPALALAVAVLAGSLGAAGPSAGAAVAPAAGAPRAALPLPQGTPSPAVSVKPRKSVSPPGPAQSDGTLQILTYRGYADYSGTTSDFEKTTGCRIARYDTVQTADQMAAAARGRSYDVISAGPVLAADLIAAKQVQVIDPAKVPGYDRLTKRFRDMTVRSGKVYGVPYLWGSHEFLYDSSRVKGEPSLKDVFGSGHVVLRDSPLTIADAALADGVEGDPFELTKHELDSAADLLEEQPGRTYWTEPLDLVKGFATGSLDYAQATPYYRLLLQQAGRPVKAVETPRVTGWVDSWMLGAGVPNTDCAYRWLAYTASATVQRKAVAWLGLAPANPEACVKATQRVCDAYGVEDPERIGRIAFATRPPDGCKPKDGCPAYIAWAGRWRALVK
ncbi:extracellular solute-binding protein [Nonomuraea rhodomycinica]|uniref:Extracellular solute-binding protein n=1 Tax=Nonomuraea rhodomycinica TaxID=1712872 RepID=A0A7Y6IM10_9ACTN|nr:extracellular solute-binding protein [Nonomuraea rhodomycinica]NUW40662.1 extracellular solute-binding protein [Nonomuraea rhodomycinica]